MSSAPRSDSPALIPHEHVATCKLGAGAECCRYLVAGAGGLACAKATELRDLLDARVAFGQMVAQGDNCPGPPFKAADSG